MWSKAVFRLFLRFGGKDFFIYLCAEFQKNERVLWQTI